MIKPMRVRKIADLQDYLKDVPVIARREAVQAAAEYFIGNGRRGLRHYPKYKEVSRKTAYPKVGGWFSKKQRRYVMMMIRRGRIDPGYPHRTGRLQRGWKIKSSGYKAMIENQEKHAEYVAGYEDTQANQPRLVGWRTVEQKIDSNFDGIRRAADLAVARELKKKAP